MKTMKFVILFLLIICTPEIMHAEDSFEVDGICYKYKSSISYSRDVIVISKSGGYSGDVVIPNKVYNSKNMLNSDVVGIDGYAFCYNSELQTVSIPASIKEIPVKAFDGCVNLKAINVDESHPSFCSIDGILYDKEITKIVLFPLAIGGEYIMPNTITSLGYNTLGERPNLTSITLGASVQLSYNTYALTSFEVGYRDPFAGCPNLKVINVAPENEYYASADGALYNKTKTVLYRVVRTYEGNFDIPEGIITISPSAFRSCTQLKEVSIPNSVTSIGNCAFIGCTGLTSLLVPSSVNSLGDGAFSGCTLKPLVYLGNMGNISTCNEFSYFKTLSGTDTDFYITKTAARNIQRYTNAYTIIDDLINIETYIRGVKYSFIEDPYLTPVSIVIEGVDSVFSDGKGTFIKNLLPQKKYDMDINWKMNNTTFRLPVSFTTLQMQMSDKNSSPTQTTIKLGFIEAKTDETVAIEKKLFRFGGHDYNEGEVIKELIPNHYYNIQTCAICDDGVECLGQIGLTTLGVSPKVTDIKAYPTSIKCNVEYTEGDALVSSTKFYFNGIELEGKTSNYCMTGLTPGTSYTINYIVNTTEGSTENYRTSIQTKSITFTNQSPKVIAEGTVIVAAKTNIADEESNVGFEWRKTDAPSTVESKQGISVIYDGTMEGLIKNLQSSSYYNVRPFYKSSIGTMYYGDWIGVDPSDYSYFEPTVHTYDNVEIHEGTVILKGYALTGTDNILEQGFEYWENKNGSSTRSNSPMDVHTIIATGQRMTAELTGLKSNTLYNFRAYVKTANNTTYGEECSFNTPVVSGIDFVYMDDYKTVPSKRFNVYSLSGGLVRHQVTSLKDLPAGIYIINRRKVIVK